MEIVQWGRLLAACCVCLLLPLSATSAPPLLPPTQGLRDDILRNNVDGLSALLARDFDSSDSDEKRSRGAFFPLRGKKIPPFDPEEDPTKRSQFYPLRGKKVPDDLKRVSYFMPMRGRKDDYPWPDEEEVKRASSFMPMRGKKRSLQPKSGTYSGGSTSGSSSRSGSAKAEGEEDRIIKSLDIQGHVTDAPKSTVGQLTEERDTNVSSASNQKLGNVSKVVDKQHKEGLPERDSLLTAAYAQDGKTSSGKDISASVRKIQKRSVEVAPESDILVSRWEDALEAPGDRIATGLIKKEEDRFVWDDPPEKKARGRRVLSPRSFRDEDKRRYYFVPMRGRRDGLEADAKRGSSFTAMRGRREFDDFEKRDFAFTAMRGRRTTEEDPDELQSLLPVRGRRRLQFYPPGMGSAFVPRHLVPSRRSHKRRRYLDWDSVKRAFHASRGKRTGADEDEVVEIARSKRSVAQPPIAVKQRRHIIALKRPMSFFATRGKRMNENSA